jgi:hypothetical protein
MFLLKRTICPLLVLATLASAGVAQAATFYVATTGNDGNTCAQAQNINTPRLTIPMGVSCLVSGDTLIIKAGTYNNQEITNPPSGSAGAYTTIKADPAGARPVIAPDYVNFQRGVYLSKGAANHHIEISGLEFNHPYEGIKLFGSIAVGHPSNINFIDNIMHDTFGPAWLASTDRPGLYSEGNHIVRGNTFYNIGIHRPHYAPGENIMYNPGSNSLVENNIAHDCTNGFGMWYTGISLQNITIRNNVFYNMGRFDLNPWAIGANGSSAIYLSVPATGILVYNNIIYNSGSFADGVSTPSNFNAYRVGTQANSSTTSSFYNNTIYNLISPGAFAVSVFNSAPTQVKNNIGYLAQGGFSGGTQSNNLLTNPSFVNAEAADFHLQSGSVAIDQGVTVAGVTVDYAGTPRPQGAAYDIGAYEGAGSGTGSMAAPKNLTVR